MPNLEEVKPVLDFRELNNYVAYHTGDDITDICGEPLREWRQIKRVSTIVDLKFVYSCGGEIMKVSSGEL